MCWICYSILWNIVFKYSLLLLGEFFFSFLIFMCTPMMWTLEQWSCGLLVQDCYIQDFFRALFLTLASAGWVWGEIRSILFVIKSSYQKMKKLAFFCSPHSCLGMSSFLLFHVAFHNVKSFSRVTTFEVRVQFGV